MRLKIIFSFLLTLMCFLNISFAQQNIAQKHYLDFNEKPIAQPKAIYWMIAFKTAPTDTIWQRELYYSRLKPVLVAKGLCSDSAGLIKQGNYIYKHDNDKISKQGSYADNFKTGEWKEWDATGKLIRKENYTNGHLTGVSISWNSDGIITDSVLLDKDGMGKGIGFYADGNIKSTGNYSAGLKEGEWVFYYDLAGNKKSMIAHFSKDEAKTFTCYSTNGDAQPQDCIYEREASFPGEGQAWVGYLVKSLENVKAEKYLASGTSYMVMLRFIIDADGTVSDVEIENPDIEKLDTKARDIIKKSPKWIPAVQYNQKVKAYRRQPLTFAVD
jgi:TonB family protein